MKWVFEEGLFYRVYELINIAYWSCLNFWHIFDMYKGRNKSLEKKSL